MPAKSKMSLHKCVLCGCEFYGTTDSYLDCCPSCKSSKYPKPCVRVDGLNVYSRGRTQGNPRTYFK
ncbi:MAG: hypothetical protein IIZ83_01430 [Oscillospiraceae bacterium]|nr:hypothetical protein [Oscillospiraceae bacterium]